VNETLAIKNDMTETAIIPPFSPATTRIDPERLIPLFQCVEKPGRYTGGEFGIATNDPETAQARLVLCYPDTYEIGMSNQGLKILYDRVNRDPRFFADRAFLPWPDFGELLIRETIPLYSLDRFFSLASFDVIGFNVSHELAYTNLLYALDLARIPRKRIDRTHMDPIVIAGGTAISNPLPITDFIDGIFIGDGEEGIIEILETVAEGKKQKKTRDEILSDLQTVDGLFLSRFYTVDDARNVGYTGRPVKRRTFSSKELSSFRHYPVAGIEIVQDRAVIEVARGCGQGCRFCHAGFWKRPVRNAPVDYLLQNADNILKKTGSDSLSLHSLSIADYPFLPELVEALARKYGPEGISLSLPSLRVQTKTIPILELTSQIRKSGVTFALEAGSEILRERIRKKASEENLRYLLEEIFNRGWDLVKIYFMIGLPDPENREIEEIIRSLNGLGEIAERCGHKKQINVTISMFVPKPFTTFQWVQQADPEYFFESITKIKQSLRSKRVHLKYPFPWMAYIEGLLSRADERAGKLIETAYLRGASFDSWDDRFRRDIWEGLLAELPDDLKTEWTAEKAVTVTPPWAAVIDGFPGERLVRDYEKFAAVTEENMKPPPPQRLAEDPERKLIPVTIPEHKFKTQCYLEVEYEKSWPANYISHLDTGEIWRKALRRAGLPMTFSHGFNKHEKFHFTEPLPIYFSSRSELLYVELYKSIDRNEIFTTVQEQLPQGLRLKEIRILPRAIGYHNEPIRYKIEFADSDTAFAIFEKLRLRPEELHFEKESRKKKHKKIAKERSVSKRLKSAIQKVVIEENTVGFTLDHPNTGAIGIVDLLVRYLELPVAAWNSQVKIERIGFEKRRP